YTEAGLLRHAAKSGLGEFLFILAFISLQLGILNLLPIPILDGGHIVFMSFEAITRREISHRIRMVSMQIGLAILLGLMIFVTINDVDNIWGFKNILESIKGLF
ncbi:site-2 protease family protein, partial [bacterium]|nr:site-2 protease family protein [bacterium]MBU1918892.1 site-2 protease family protein [bacterium]